MKEMNEAEYNRIQIAAKNEIHDDVSSIWVFGNLAQDKLVEFSRVISNTVLTDELDIQALLTNTINKLQALSIDNQTLFGKVLPSKRQRYTDVLNVIDHLTIQLRLRQAQLLKNLTIYEQMEELIGHCQKELEIYIDVGEAKLSEKEISEQDSVFSLNNQDSWGEHFQRKLNELRTSLIVSSQSELQLKLMKQNCSCLAEKIGEVLSTTIPVWRNQAALLLELDNYKKGSLNQTDVNKATEQTIRLNTLLKDSLNDVFLIDEEDRIQKKKMIDIFID